MLTSAQKAKCAVIAAALDAGDLAPWRKSEASLGPEMRGEIWDLRAHVIAAGGRGRKKTLPPTDGRVSSAMTSAGVADLDYWGDEPAEPDDDPDDELTLKTKVCDNCRGLGTTSDGTRCSRCNGTGRVDRDDVDDGDDDRDRDREDDDDDE